MRTMMMDPDFIIRLSKENGYTITNAPVNFDMIPQPENFKHPAIKVYDVPAEDGTETVKISECLQLPYDPPPRDRHFIKKIGKKAIYGHSRFWKLLGVSVYPFGVALVFGCKKDLEKELVCLVPPSEKTLCAMFDDGSSQFRLTMRGRSGGSSWHYIEIVEYIKQVKKHKLVFNTGERHPVLYHPEHEGYYDINITVY